MLSRLLHGPRCLPQAHRLFQPCNIRPFQVKRRYAAPTTAARPLPFEDEERAPANWTQDTETLEVALPGARVTVQDALKVKEQHINNVSVGPGPDSRMFREVGVGLGITDAKVDRVQGEVRRALKGDGRMRGSVLRNTTRNEHYSQRARRTRANRAARATFHIVGQELVHALSKEERNTKSATGSFALSARSKHKYWRCRWLRNSGVARARLRLVGQSPRHERSSAPSVGPGRFRQRHHTIRMINASPHSEELDVYGRRVQKPETTARPQRPIVRDHFLSLGSWAQKTQEILKEAEKEYSKPNLDPIDIAWSTKFTRVCQGHRFNIWMSPNIERLVGSYASLDSGRKHIHLAWMSLPQNLRARLWQDVMLWCLQNSPKRALNLLTANLRGHRLRPARNVAEDCLKFLTKHYLRDASEREPWAFNALWRLTSVFVQVGMGNEDRTTSLPQLIVYYMLKHCDDAASIKLYWMLVLNRAFFHVNSMLHFLKRFVEMGKIRLCMRTLGMVARSGSDMSRDQIQSACVRLLRARWKLEDPYPIQAKITTQMLEMGISPNTQMFNCILLNTIQSHNFDLALQMFEKAVQAGFATNSITYCILLKGAKLSGNNNFFEFVLEKTSEQPEMLQDLRLASDLLHTIGVFSPHDEFSSKFEFYKEHFDLGPLQELGLCGPEIKSPPGKIGNGHWPTKYILGQMIMVYNKTSGSSARLIDRYQRFHKLVQEKHPLCAALARDSYVPDSFIMAMGRKSETLQYCATVVKHMLDTPQSRDHPPYAPPSVQTWTILASSYFHKRQRRAGEKVITMMKERGLEPDKVTWDTIINGYAHFQDVDAAVDSVKRMEASGYEVDSMTLKKLGRLWNRNRLLDAFEERIGPQEERVQPVPPENPNSWELGDPEEVETMARGWEAKPSDRDSEVKKYLTSYYKERLGMEGDGSEIMGEQLERLEKELNAVDRFRKMDVD